MKNNVIKDPRHQPPEERVLILPLFEPAHRSPLHCFPARGEAGAERRGERGAAGARPDGKAGVLTRDYLCSSNAHYVFEITDVGKQALAGNQRSCRMSLNTLSSTSCLHRVIQGK